MTTEIARFMRQLERIWDRHQDAVLAGRPLDVLMQDMTAEPAILHLPTMAGASGRVAVQRFYAEELTGYLPGDLTLTRISRTVDRFRLVDEVAVAFTHDRELPWLLPGAAPTHRAAEVRAITLVDFSRGRINAVRTLWDHATLTAQLGVPSLVASGVLPPG